MGYAIMEKKNTGKIIQFAVDAHFGPHLPGFTLVDCRAHQEGTASGGE